MAPERLDDTPVTPASDVYSLCSTIFRLVCGHAPFERGDDSAAQIVRRMLEEAAPIADLRARDAPASFCRVIERGLARYPADRQQSALDLGRELRDARADAGTTPTPVNLKDATFPSAPPPPASPRTAGGTVRTDARPGRTETALVVMLALLLVGAGITLAVRLGDREPPSATAVGGPGARPRVTGLTVAPTPDGPGFGDPLQISGVVVDRPVDRQLRVVLATVDRTRFDPQDVVAPREDGSWTMAVQLAIPTPEPTYRFSVLVVQVDAAGGRQLDDYITRAQATRDFTGLPVLPDGSEIVASTTLTLPRLRA
jgi:hypothetical protein